MGRNGTAERLNRRLETCLNATNGSFAEHAWSERRVLRGIERKRICLPNSLQNRWIQGCGRGKSKLRLASCPTIQRQTLRKTLTNSLPVARLRKINVADARVFKIARWLVKFFGGCPRTSRQPPPLIHKSSEPHTERQADTGKYRHDCCAAGAH